MGLFRREPDWLERLIAKQVVIVTKDSRSIRGYVDEVYEDAVALRDAERLNEAEITPMGDRRAIVPRDNVSYLQAP